MISLVEICEVLNASATSQKSYTLREIYVNPKHVVSLREEVALKQRLVESNMPDDLDPRQDFTRITLDKGHTGLDIIVIGRPNLIEAKLKGDPRELLHG